MGSLIPQKTIVGKYNPFVLTIKAAHNTPEAYRYQETYDARREEETWFITGCCSLLQNSAFHRVHPPASKISTENIPAYQETRRHYYILSFC